VSSSSSQKELIYPEIPVATTDIKLETVPTGLVDIYTSVKIQVALRQVYDVNISNLHLELIGLFFYSATSSELTVPGSYTPIRGSFATSDDVGQLPKFYMAPETGFLAELDADPYKITITDKDYQTISFDKIDTEYVLTGSKVLTATASSGLPITYTSSDPTIASVSGSTLTYVGASGGTVTITASQAGNADFEPAVDVSRSFIIRPPYCVQIPAKAGGTPNAKGINIPYSAIQENEEFTMMWWQYLVDPDIATTGAHPNTYTEVLKVDGSADVMYIRYNGQVFTYRIGGTNSIGANGCPLGFASADYSVTWDTWQHIAFSRSGTEIKHYLDGVEVFSVDTTVNPLIMNGFGSGSGQTDETNPGPASNFRLGGSHSTYGPWPFGSYYNDAAIWDGRHLTGSEIAAIHADGFEHIAPPTLMMSTKSGPDSLFRMGDDDFRLSKVIQNVGNRPAPQQETNVGPGGASSADTADLLDEAQIIPLADV